MFMRRRLYFLLPDIASARAMLNDLLLARIEVGHIHLLARRDVLPDDLPAANVLQKTDVIHGATQGIMIGGIAGACAGGLFVLLGLRGALSAESSEYIRKPKLICFRLFVQTAR